MTLGQKLKALLKDNSMTQEDLAERLEVYRQAVGKWVNDKGIPEVGKLIQISNLFGVSMDYLLKEDCEEKNVSKERSVSDSGYYVSQEMLDGYLSYSRQNVNRIAGGISLFVLSNVFDCFDHHSMIMSFLYWLTMIAGIIIISWHFFQTKQYQEIKNERLTFDDKVFGEFRKRRESRRKKYAVIIIVGVIIFMASPEIDGLLMINFGQTARNVFGWIADKKIYIKIGILLVFVLCVCAGCSSQQGGKYTIEDLDNLAEIRIYSAENNELINTVSDEEQLYQYNQCSLFDDSDITEHQAELEKELEGATEQYYLTSYKHPVARFGAKELEENITITLYENTNIIKMTVAGESIKAFSVPEEFLTFYYEISEEDMNFYRSLVE